MQFASSRRHDSDVHHTTSNVHHTTSNVHHTTSDVSQPTLRQKSLVPIIQQSLCIYAYALYTSSKHENKIKFINYQINI